MILTLSALIVCAQLDALDLAKQVDTRPTAAGYRQLADQLAWAREFPKASLAYQKAADWYGKLGDPNAAQVLQAQASRYRTDAAMFVDTTQVEQRAYPLARLEPAYGCYLGVNIERNDGPREPEDFDKEIGKPQAIYFIYRKFGNDFPRDLADDLRGLHAGLQLAWEPASLSDVYNDSYVDKFVKDISDSGIPVFLRFASEMNGDWTPYHGDPAAYVRAFQYLADKVHRVAQNAAMVWCPNEIPQEGIDSYYPGDEAVDWVGVNFYSVVYNDGKRDRVASWRNPADAVKYVYDHFAARHPMMIGEWGATHESVVDGVDRSDFAVDKIGQLYAALPRLYPRIKAVHWLSMNTEKYAEGDRKLNDFCLTDSPSVEAAYSTATKPDYYLSEATLDVKDGAIPRPSAAVQGQTVRGTITLSSLVRSYEDRPTVTYLVNGKRMSEASNQAGAHEFQFDTTQFKNGKLKVELLVTDSSGQIAGSQVLTFLADN